MDIWTQAFVIASRQRSSGGEAIPTKLAKSSQYRRLLRRGEHPPRNDIFKLCFAEPHALDQ
jgi:hypothetical protein